LQSCPPSASPSSSDLRADQPHGQDCRCASGESNTDETKGKTVENGRAS
jgi:hypothetical protein